jgi:type I restriction enzyme M protein
LQEFVECFRASARGTREESERFKRFGYDELLTRDEVSLGLTWLCDEALEDLENLPPADVIAREIVEDLEAAPAEFAVVAEALGERPAS